MFVFMCRSFESVFMKCQALCGMVLSDLVFRVVKC